MSKNPETHPNVVSELLASLKVAGQILLIDEYQPPWGIEIPAGKDLTQHLGVSSQSKVVPFHIVRRGWFELRYDQQDPRVIRSGEVAICTGSDPHQMIQGDPKRLVRLDEILKQGIQPIAETAVGGSTELVCGVFVWQNTKRNPLVDALPAVLHTDVSGRQGKTLESLTQLMINELTMDRAGFGYMVSRLVELVCAESIRQYLDRHSHDEPGWCRAMSDPRIGPAINAIHASPQDAHSVASLAQQVNMSGSRFAARFKEVLGQSVMSYVSNWRINVAIQYLLETDLNLENIAHSVGYDSSAAFSRAFSRICGLSPAAYRKSNQQNNKNN